MPNHHRGNCNMEWVRSIKWSAVLIMKERRLNSELHCGDQGRGVYTRVSGNCSSNNPLTRNHLTAAGYKTIRAVGNKRSYDCHVEGVGSKGGNTAISEQQGLNRERNRYGQN